MIFDILRLCGHGGLSDPHKLHRWQHGGFIERRWFDRCEGCLMDVVSGGRIAGRLAMAVF
jgi:hypothetical protein